ncbi:MAG: MFS transporter [Promethearchaeota archaeon]|nr:MAG: MFS transporter [Candidatus Lokiarchaeota archaeon]
MFTKLLFNRNKIENCRTLINKTDNEEFSTKLALGYSIGQFSDTIAIETFTFFLFTFYYSVVELNIDLITIGFIIWAIWNAFNDPMLGVISDKTHSKWGRRIPYIIIAIGPLCVVTYLLWTPPLGSEVSSFIYFLIIIILFEFFYTMYDLNYASLFPEMFLEPENRAKANTIKQIMTIFGLIVAFIAPTLFIPKLDDPAYYLEYRFAGLIMSIIIAIGAIICISTGLKQREEFSKEYETALPFLKSLKFSLKNKSFRKFIIANLAHWYIIGLLPTIVPLFGIHVLNIGEGESLLLGILLGVSFVSAAIFMPFWYKISIKFGIRKAFMISMTSFIIVLSPFMFINNKWIAFIFFFLVGLGLSGSLLYVDLILAAIIDEDELKTGTRREGGYYGVNALITKLSTIFVFVSINIVFKSIGWENYVPKFTTQFTIFGLRSLIFIFPSIALIIAIISIYKFPITKEKYKEIKIKSEELHKEKREKLGKSLKNQS